MTRTPLEIAVIEAIDDCDSPACFGGTTLELSCREMSAICREAFGGGRTAEIPYETAAQVVAADPLRVYRTR